MRRRIRILIEGESQMGSKKKTKRRIKTSRRLAKIRMGLLMTN